MNNISYIQNCYGCGVCVIACVKKIIDLRLNNDGFYEPYIQEIDKCTNCGQCVAVCSYIDDEPAIEPQKVISYATWSENQSVRKESSSGGLGYEIGRFLLSKGYQVCGVKYNTKLNRAEHFMTTELEDWKWSQGSKYIKSYTLEGFKYITRKGKFFVTGTPCQIDSLRRYIKKNKIEDNFILLDFFCHGVPSFLLWDKYVQDNREKVGAISHAGWRNKKIGWHNSYMISLIGDKSTHESLFTNGDIFYRFFLGNYCLNKPCYQKCKFKYLSSSADLRIGDMWGKKYANNDDGVTSLIAFTNKGCSILEEIDGCHLQKESVKDSTEGQYKKPLKEPFIRKMVINALKGTKPLQLIHSFYCKPYMLLMIPKRVLKKITKR